MRHCLLWAKQVDIRGNKINQPAVFNMLTLHDKENKVTTYKIIERLNTENRCNKQEDN